MEVTHLSVVELDLPAPALSTSLTPALGSPTPSVPVIDHTSVSNMPPVDIEERPAVLRLLADIPQLLPSPERSIGRTSDILNFPPQVM